MTENHSVGGSIPPQGTSYAVVAQLVERHLAKVEVASPSLVYRSIYLVPWPSGKAKVCKTFTPRFKSGCRLHIGSADEAYCGGYSQVVKTAGCGSVMRGFESCHPDHTRPLGQAVKTPPFHGGNTGSSPVEVAIFSSRQPGPLAQLVRAVGS